MAFMDLDTLRFGEPAFLWLLLVPAALLALWCRQVLSRRGDVRRFARSRVVPARERFSFFGDAAFWLAAIGAIACLVVALAEPRVVQAVVRSSGADLVIVLDGSASMHVRDVTTSRWQRSVAFLRVLGDGLSWEHDRVALALFAHVAVPQIRLTRDPNTFFFFLDHLVAGPPFRLEDATSWDTNIALGLKWGLRVIERDEQVNGASTNGRLLVLLSDGQAWSGAVEESVRDARARGIPIVVIGVGTERGLAIPDPQLAAGPGPAIVSRLDRASLTAIAAAGRGRYFELDRDSDSNVANQIIDMARQRAVSVTATPVLQEAYWQTLLGAGGLIVLGTMCLRDRSALWVQIAAAALAAAAMVVALGL